MDGIVFFFKQKTAYEMRISDWSSDVCSTDLTRAQEGGADGRPADLHRRSARRVHPRLCFPDDARQCAVRGAVPARHLDRAAADRQAPDRDRTRSGRRRSEEHTSELQSLMRISYAVFCLKKKKTINTTITTIRT